MDEADHAQIYEEQERHAGVLRATQPPNIEPLIINDIRVCIDCEEAIEQQRLDAKRDAVRCVFCQSTYEKRGRE